MTEKWHGTPGGYSNHKCRCDPCRTTWNKYCADRKRKRRSEYVFNPLDPHGDPKTYQKGCTCDACKDGHNRYTLQVRRGESAKSGVCEICQREGKVVWDHDHASGDHRGWLCIKCNQGLGLFRDNLDRIRAAISYLEGQN